GLEQLRHERVVGDDAAGLTAGVNVVSSGEGDELLDLRTKLFRLRKSVVDARRELVAEERVAMRARASQLAVDHSVSHFDLPRFLSRASRRRGTPGAWSCRTTGRGWRGRP